MYFCSKGDPYVDQIGAKCSWTLRMGENRSLETVGLNSDFAETLIKEICQDLDCGGVYHVDKTTSLHNITCLQQCTYKNLHLHNCSETTGSNCSVINKVICGKNFIVTLLFYNKKAFCCWICYWMTALIFRSTLWLFYINIDGSVKTIFRPQW